MLQLKEMVVTSILNANAIGLPSPKHFYQEVTEKNKTALLGLSFAVISSQRYIQGIEKSSIYDTFICHGINRDNLFYDILSDIDYLGLINHTDLSLPISKKFGIERCEFIKIPGHNSFMDAQDNHFPDGYLKVLDTIKVPFKGAVYLVGAGYLGKYYCNQIKEQGGIAIDIGSVFDAWSGIGRTDATKNKKMRLI